MPWSVTLMLKAWDLTGMKLTNKNGGEFNYIITHVHVYIEYLNSKHWGNVVYITETIKINLFIEVK